MKSYCMQGINLVHHVIFSLLDILLEANRCYNIKENLVNKGRKVLLIQVKMNQLMLKLLARIVLTLLLHRAPCPGTKLLGLWSRDVA